MMPPSASDNNNAGNGRGKNATALAFVTAMLILFGLSPWFTRLEEAVGLSWLFQWRGAIEPPDSVVIVAIDSDTAERMGLPAKVERWPRSLHAGLIRTLHGAGATSIAFDIAFKEARPGAQDRELAEAIGAAGNVALFKYLQRPQPDPISIDDRALLVLDIEREILPLPDLAEQAAVVASFTLPKIPVKVDRVMIYTELSAGPEVTLPLAALSLHLRAHLPALLTAIKSIAPDLHLALQGLRPHEVLLALRQRLTADKVTAQQLRRQLRTYPPPQRQQLSTLLAAALQANPLYINYYGPPRTVRTISYDALLAGKHLDEISGKAVFVGLVEKRQTEQWDVYHTIFSQANGVDISGVEIAASVFANLHQRSALERPGAAGSAALLVCWAAVLYLLMVCLAVKTALLWQAVICAAYAGTAYLLFSHLQWWLPVATPLALLLPVNLAALSTRYQRSRAAQLKITEALQHYLPSDVAQQVSNDFSRYRERHRLVQGICLLTDIQGYTAIAERLPPHDLHRVMNQYYARLMANIKQQGGKVGNIVGDSLLALWTADTLQQEACEKACHAALAIRQCFRQTTVEGVALPTSIGIHGGAFSLGNLGAMDHYEYSPVGDIVNASTRLEALNRKLGTQILLTEAVAEKMIAKRSADFIIRYLGHFKVKNKTQPLVVHELIGHRSQLDTGCEALIGQFAEALSHFEMGEKKRALAAFTLLLRRFPDDGPSRYYQNICREYVA